MALMKLEDFEPNYTQSFEGDDVKNFGVYTESEEKIGSVSNVLVDEEGRFRYLVVDLGFWIFGKKVLLPVGLSRIDYNADRVYAMNMTRKQAEDLPEFNENTITDFDYEERVRRVYRDSYNTNVGTGYQNFDRNTYDYEQEPSFFGMNDRDHQTFRLYEERLIANKSRRKAGEVAIGKHVETERAQVSVPVEKERVIIERNTPVDAGRSVTPGDVNFREGEVARIEVYEETPDIHKEAFVREEVNVKKVVDRDTVERQETVRRERLDIDTDGNPIIDNSDRI
ncbi:DUF2382 domain-containing protein [Aerosakkonemataceae cyanobacterium BLCC-F154]|uniref:DUF2382 domain-containing protein n=1 Tax=Floridaenema fluviatile BLCC-F154 TaxID=3153640 RepID=A0ABV4Y6C5_9CYAN